MSTAVVRRIGTGVSAVAGVVAAAAMFGMGAAHAAPADDVAAAAAAVGAGTPLSDASLSTAVTNMEAVTSLLNGVPVGGLISAADATAFDAGFASYLTSLDTAENTILAHSGFLSGLVDQLFFDPLNQQWADVSATTLSAVQTFASGADGTVQGGLTAFAQMMFDGLGLVSPALETGVIIGVADLF